MYEGSVVVGALALGLGVSKCGKDNFLTLCYRESNRSNPLLRMKGLQNIHERNGIGCIIILSKLGGRVFYDIVHTVQNYLYCSNLVQYHFLFYFINVLISAPCTNFHCLLLQVSMGHQQLQNTIIPVQG